jgi:hypothetical protein
MKAARAVFIWKAVSGDSTTMTTGAERIGTGRTGSEGTGTEPTGIERIGIERIGIEQIGIEETWSEGTWAIGTSQIASATIVEGLRASMANGTLKATPAESLNSSQCPTAIDKNVDTRWGSYSPAFFALLACYVSYCGAAIGSTLTQVPLRLSRLRR